MKCWVSGGTGRIREALVERLTEHYVLTHEESEADVVFIMPQPIHQVAPIIHRLSSKPVIDFSSFTKLNTTEGYALAYLLFPDETRSPAALWDTGHVAIAGCFASSVLIPINYLAHYCGLKPDNISAFCLGGIETDTTSDQRMERWSRQASEKSLKNHRFEVEKFLLGNARTQMSITVADLDHSIETTVHISCPGHGLDSSMTLRYAAQDCRWYQDDTERASADDVLVRFVPTSSDTLTAYVTLDNVHFLVHLAMASLSLLSTEHSESQA
ncbi:hypothetical protein [Paenibacillus xylaniclasticus]|uniref:hypothetical protein n=1 Tax=Paenibacillus xylaniclasticus TaxID=588083 RepID=UPI000FD74A1A|nr:MULTISPECIES: hypothetical protein [Paenibacillus]GFN32229.1 hypothetical protein PCURB6_24890 [Paenibacillus curdlanolyticus]